MCAQLCPTLCNSMDCSPPGTPVHGIILARRLEWVTIPFSRDHPNSGIEPTSPALAGRFFTNEPPGKPTVYQIKPKLSGFKQQTCGLSFCRSGIWVQFTQTLRLSQTSEQTSHNAATQGQVLHLPNLIPLNSGQSKVHPESTQCCHPIPRAPSPLPVSSQ